MSVCKYCQQEIVWDNKRPYNTDGAPHRCPPGTDRNAPKGPIQKVPVDVIKPAASASTSPAVAATPTTATVKEVTIECVISVDNWESLRIGVTGTSAEACRSYLVDTLKGYASTSPATKEKITRYMERVFGVI